MTIETHEPEFEGPAADRLYRALASRDARFDGRFFVGVRSTGIYCRPVCPARTPRREHVRFFSFAAAAERAGFRPCRRCRPEAAPGSAAWSGSPALVRRALRLVGEGALDDDGVDALASRLGVGARHLRRLFVEHVGATPREVARSRRAHFARRLIDETDLPMTAIAHASGFASLRRFNAVVRATFAASPTELRRNGHGTRAASGGVSLRIAYREPYDREAILDYLAGRAIPGVEDVSGGVYRRALLAGGEPARVSISFEGDVPAVRIVIEGPITPSLVSIVFRSRRLFDLDAEPGRIRGHLSRDPALARAIDLRPGLRVPGAWDGFELAVRAILGQQVSVKGATTLSGRLVARYGTRIHAGGAGPTHVFPTPEKLSRARLTGVGIPEARARAIRTLARSVAAGRLDLSPSADPAKTHRQLVAIPGIGEWTASYVALRALSDPDVFLPGDLGVRKALAPEGHRLATPRAARDRAEVWRPWRAYAMIHLWTSGLEGGADR